MDEGTALVCSVESDEPWVIEVQLIRTLSLPLNLDQNRMLSVLFRSQGDSRGHDFSSEIVVKRSVMPMPDLGVDNYKSIVRFYLRLAGQRK